VTFAFRLTRTLPARLRVAADVLRDPRGGTPGVGGGDHLDAVADLGRQPRSPQGFETGSGCVVGLGATHAEL
jgi:hypothetical protein